MLKKGRSVKSVKGKNQLDMPMSGLEKSRMIRNFLVFNLTFFVESCPISQNRCG